jgi:hypothetical protein
VDSHRGGPASTRVQSACHLWQSGSLTGFSPNTSVSPAFIIPPLLHTHLHLHVAPTRRTTVGSLKINPISGIQEHSERKHVCVFRV